ncbi:MAG: nucleotide disphospho-sugar-binding domain-containing protein [Sphingobium sp.]
MSRFVFTMASSEDLGLPSRLIPVARGLRDRGHDVAIINSAKGPGALIAEMGLQRLDLPEIAAKKPPFDMRAGARAFDVEHLMGLLYSDIPYFEALTNAFRQAFQAFRPDVVIDSFGPFSCLAARIESIPLVQLTQGNFLADSPGFLWWEGERPAGLPSAADAISAVAAQHGLPPVVRAADILDGDRIFLVGSPETDPVDAKAGAVHVGSLAAGQVDAGLPDWLDALGRDRKLVWVYTGNPRYGGTAVATPFDSEIILQAALGTLGDRDVDVVLTTGYQAVPEGMSFPPNIHFANFVSGPAMAARCDLMIHHGGHGSMVNGLAAGKPAVIIPTNSERESNARRLASLGACEVVQPIDSWATEKRVDHAVFAAAVERVLSEPSYRQAAQAVGERLRQLGGAGEIVANVEALAAG